LDVFLEIIPSVNKEFELYRKQQVFNWDNAINQNTNINTNSGKATLYDFFVIVDTNILLYKQKFLSDLFQFPRDFKVAIVIPWIVIQELDGLKNSTKVMDNNISLSKLARSALSLILKYTIDENSNLIGQKFNEVLNVGNPMFSKNDDKILDCCLFFRQTYLKDVFLLSNDKALCVKSVFSNIKVIESWNDGAEAFIMHITSIDENKAQNVANSVRPFSHSNSLNNNNNNNNNSIMFNHYSSNTNNNSNNNNVMFNHYNNNNNNNNLFNQNNNNNNNNNLFNQNNNNNFFNNFNTQSFNNINNNNNNNNNDINLNKNGNSNFNFRSNSSSINKKNNTNSGYKDYDFLNNSQSGRSYDDFDFDFQTEGYSSVDYHKKILDEFDKSLEEDKSLNNHSSINNKNKNSNSNFSLKNSQKSKKKYQNNNDLFDDLDKYKYSSVNDHKKLMEDYERSLSEKNEIKNNDEKSKGIKRKQEFDEPMDITKFKTNSPISNNSVLLNRKIINPTRRIKQRTLSGDSNNLNVQQNLSYDKQSLNINDKSRPTNEVKPKKMRTNNHLPLTNNSINMTHNNEMAIETNFTSSNCTRQMINIVENYLPNALKKFLDNNVKKNKPVPNTIPYVLPTKINDIFSLIINSWDFFKKGYPSFYGDEPLTKIIETQSLFDKFRNQSQELTEKELSKISKNLEQILEICEGLEGREVSIKRRKELKNIKEMIKKNN